MKRVLSTLFASLLILGGFNTLAALAKPAASGELAEAHKDLDQLKRLLVDRKAENKEIIAYIEVVRVAHEKAEGADEDVASFRRAAEARLMTALSKARVKKDANRLSEVNIAAAQALGKLAPSLDEKVRISLSKKVVKALEGLRKARYDVETDRIEATFLTAARLGNARTLAWMLDEYSHTKSNEAVFLISAHRAMVTFENVPGALRHAIVKKFKQDYPGVEALAKQNTNTPAARAAKMFWDRVRVDVVKVMQYFAGNPTNAKGEALSTAKEFQEWFRDHKSVRKAPWVDPK